ncbi:MAG TPA: PfkB family carbohydrate kinase [Thermoproteota archaeon]|nr:PfkB family carbohydrate kinase [Thermoproteota archaeon]
MSRVLVIGGLTLDVIKTKEKREARVGGGAYYCSITGARLGASVELRTSVGSDMPKSYLSEIESEGVSITVQKSQSSIGFVNELMRDGRRIQQVVSIGGPPITVDADTVSEFDAVQVTPVLSEVDPAMVSISFPRATGIEAQGFVRERRTGNLVMKPWKDRDRWTAGKLLLHLSDEEILYSCNRSLNGVLTPKGPATVALTRSSEGSFILTRSGVHFVPSLSIDVVDDVGCGDVYAMTMLLSLLGGKDPIESAFSATAAATLAAEGHGLEMLHLDGNFREREKMVSEKFEEFGLENGTCRSSRDLPSRFDGK